MLLKDKKHGSNEGRLVKLQASKIIQSHHGNLAHADVIGKEPRQLVQSSRGHSYRIHEPTLAEYVRLTPRLVTPVRPPHSTCTAVANENERQLTEVRYTLQMRT